jgi:hypothetical protein
VSWWSSTVRLSSRVRRRASISVCEPPPLLIRSGAFGAYLIAREERQRWQWTGAAAGRGGERLSIGAPIGGAVGRFGRVGETEVVRLVGGPGLRSQGAGTQDLDRAQRGTPNAGRGTRPAVQPRYMPRSGVGDSGVFARARCSKHRAIFTEEMDNSDGFVVYHYGDELPIKLLESSNKYE